MARDVTRHSAGPKLISDISHTLVASCTTTGLKTTSTAAQKPLQTSMPQCQPGCVQETDERVLQSLKSVLGSPLEEVIRIKSGDYGFDFELIGYRVKGSVSSEIMAEAQLLIEQVSKPATRPQLANALTKLAAATASRKRDLDLEAFMEVAIEDLAEFPVDVVEEALCGIRRRETFLPSVAELRDECRWIGRRRLALQILEVAQRP